MPMTPLTSPEQETSPDLWSYQVLGDQHFWSARLSWWYRLTSPPDAPAEASFAQRDRVRRGRLASALMLFLLLVLLLASAIGFFGTNHVILAVTPTMFVAILISIPFNRRGLVEVVGVVMALGLTGGMYTSMLTAPGGLAPADKDILYLLFFSDLFVATLLPVNWVWVVAALNVFLSSYLLFVARHTPALDTLLAHGGAWIVLFRVVQIHVIVSGVVWILLGNLQAAIRRADRAEEVARLQHDLAEIARQTAREKAVLEQSMAAIIEVHVRLANGDVQARVPITQGNVLWQVAGPLNTLLGRYQQAREAEAAYLHLARFLAQIQRPFQQAVQHALQEQCPFVLPAGTPLEPLFQEVRGLVLIPPPASTRSSSAPLFPSHSY